MDVRPGMVGSPLIGTAGTAGRARGARRPRDSISAHEQVWRAVVVVGSGRPRGRTSRTTRSCRWRSGPNPSSRTVGLRPAALSHRGRCRPRGVRASSGCCSCTSNRGVSSPWVMSIRVAPPACLTAFATSSENTNSPSSMLPQRHEARRAAIVGAVAQVALVRGELSGTARWAQSELAALRPPNSTRMHASTTVAYKSVARVAFFSGDRDVLAWAAAALSDGANSKNTRRLATSRPLAAPTTPRTKQRPSPPIRRHQRWRPVSRPRRPRSGHR
jgi:hypothetical protein